MPNENDEKVPITQTAEFWFACGIAFGCVLGLGIGYWTSYQNGLNYAAQAVNDYIAQLPLSCQQDLGWGNHTKSYYEPFKMNVTTNGSVSWYAN